MDDLVWRVVAMRIADRNHIDQLVADDSIKSPELLLGRLIREGLLTPYQGRRLCANRNRKRILQCFGVFFGCIHIF